MAAGEHPCVYLIEPDPVERMRIMRALAGYAREVVAFDSGREYLALSAEDPEACVVVALALPDMRTVDFVAKARHDIPIVVMGRVEDLSVAVELIRAGATDVLDIPCDARRLRAAIRAATSRANTS